VFTGRQGMLGEVVWNTQAGWPDIKPLGEKASLKKLYRDDFSTTVLSNQWQWDFRHASPKTKIEKGALYLSGQTTTDNATGTVLTVRPIISSYEMKTEVVNQNASLKGLTLYGDAGQSVGIGIQNNSIQVWEVKKDKRSILKEEKLSEGGPVQLKVAVEKGAQLRFYWSVNGQEWKEIRLSEKFYNGDFLPPWDRSPRPGLMQKGEDAAAFSFFEITYQ